MTDTPAARAAPELIFGAGCLARLPEALTRHAAGSLASAAVLLVTDAGLMATSHPERARALIAASGHPVSIFSEVRENPDEDDVAACLEFARASCSEVFVALGGGSSIDTARAAIMLRAGGGLMRDYRGHRRGPRPLAPLIAIPTTAGTGSECQSFALISHSDSHVKMACGDPEAGARVALLDPELTLTQPRRVTALTGLDALVHALETLVTTKRNAESERHARRSFSLINGAFQGVLDRPSELAARADMQRAAAHAGAAIEHSMLGAAHACANPLTSRFELAHGAAVALMLPSVMRFNAADSKARELYASVARDHRLEAGVQDQYGSASALIRRVEQLIRAGGVWLKGGPAAYGVDPDALDSLARDAQAQWTGQFNPRPLSEAAIVGLYRDAFEQT